MIQIVKAESSTDGVGHTCRAGCTRKIQKGEVVLEIYLNYPMPADNRWHFIHASCLAVAIQDGESILLSDEDAIAGLKSLILETAA